MDATFPFGLPQASAIYLSLYVVTFAVHIVLMSYVLAGTGYVAVSTVRNMRGTGKTDPLALLLRDWLPFGLGAAITAGVAPLLFVQVLYRHSFYTANLLLFNRWMAIVPVLIVGFYLLYLHKSDRAATWRPVLRAAVPCAALACFAFVAFSWTENHLLAMDPKVWVSFYTEERLLYTSVGLVPRVAFWIMATLPLMSLITAYQLRAAADDSAARRLAIMAAVGIAGMVGFASLYIGGLDAASRTALTSPMARPYVIAAGAGAAVQLVAWVSVWRRRQLSGRMLGLAAAGAAATTLGIAIAREALRLSHFDAAAQHALHARTAEASGMALFLCFLVANALVIAWCFRITRRGLRGGESP